MQLRHRHVQPQTERRCDQFTGDAIVGEMLGSALKPLPARHEPSAKFKALHTGGKLRVLNAPSVRAYGRDVGIVEAVAASAGDKGRRLPYDVTFVFVAHAYHPDVPVVKN